MRLILAPMEGLADHFLRRLITAQGGFDWVVSEFVRVVDRPLPASVFERICPELKAGGRTAGGTPVRVQLLGNHLDAMAANAVRAIELGSYGIDLNFGCPSKTVNRSQGGAILLREPETLYRVVRAVRQALPDEVVVSAKMRLGYEDAGLMIENAQAIESAGASELTVHARTKVQGYAPPAHWQALAEIRQAVSLPLIANGDIWTVDDYRRCTAIAGTEDVMLGRGAIRTPDLARRIRQPQQAELQWPDYQRLLAEFWREVRARMPARYCAGRLKQWVNHLRQTHPEAQLFWQRIRAEAELERLDPLLLDLD